MRVFDRIFARKWPLCVHRLRFIKFGRGLSEGTAYFNNNNRGCGARGLQRVLILFHIHDYCTLFHFYAALPTLIDRCAALMRITVHSTFITAIYFLIYLIHLRFQSRIILFPQSPFHFS